jgi:hypothetical protein
MVPLVQSVVGAVLRDQIGSAFGVGIMGLAVTSLLFVQLASGASSSNWGTYFRSREPIRYWLDVAILSIAYVGICFAGWYIK